MTEQTDNREFNRHFCHDQDKELIEILRRVYGCFSCGKPKPKSTCSKCKVVKYCNRECQRKDWKRHKGECDTWCENYGNSVAIPICLRSCGFTNDTDFIQQMRHRQKYFMEEAQRVEVKAISMTIACVEMFDSVRLVAEANFMDKGRNMQQVSHVIYETVDKGEEASRNLYPLTGGSGSVSTNAKKLVIKHVEDFVTGLNEHDVQVTTMTFGRGVDETFFF